MQNARTITMMAGKKVPIYLNWLQSDGAGYVDTDFLIRDYKTRALLTAAYSGRADGGTLNAVFFAGIDGVSNFNNLNLPAFGFTPFFNDRQIYFRVGGAHFWNASSNVGNWNDGNIHNIEVGATGTNQVTASFDGSSIAMTRVGGSIGGAIPNDTQAIFASKYNGAFYHVSSVFKIRRIAYLLDGILLSDFRAAEYGGEYGFYDEIAGVFHPATGGLISGGELIV